MRFCSSSLTGLTALLLALAVAAGCSPQRAAETRALPPSPPSPLDQELKAAPGSERPGTWLDDVYESSRSVTACQWLSSMARPASLEAKFQLLERSDVRIISDEQSATKQYRLDISGVIDPGGSPLYSYALLSQTIPSKEEFLGLVRQEREKSPGFPLKLILGEWLMRTGMLDPFKQRNKIIEEKINEALPGIFADSGSALFKLKDSIPWMILRNGSPELSSPGLGMARGLTATPDPLERLRFDQELYKELLSNYGKVAPVFSGATWRSFSDDFRMGLSTAVRAFRTTDPAEKTCATALLHRLLSQLFMIIGYDRLPYQVRSDGQGFRLPAIGDLLDSPQGTRFMVCPTAGSFLKDGRRMIIDRDVLTAFDREGEPFELSGGPAPLPICDRAAAVPYSLDLHKDLVGEPVSIHARGSDWLALINALSNLLATFNPGAPWWRDPDNTIGFPMAPFESLDRIKTSGAILPVDANALSLGLMNLSIASFLKKHLIFLDASNRVVTDLDQASKIRVSEAVYNPSDTPRIDTRLESAALLAETAFKLGETLKLLSAWYRDANAMMKDELAREKDPRKRLLLMREFDGFVEGMYGDKEILRDLTVATAGSMRDQVESLKLASALLLAEFAHKEPSGRYGCISRLELDPPSGHELRQGTCTGADKALWKYALSLVAREYRSPHFAALAE